jgi:hypothetical protein
VEKKNSPILRLLGTVLGLTLVVSLIVTLIGIMFQWNTPVQFSNGFFAAGALAIVLGTFTVTAGFEQRGTFSLLYAETASQASISERTQRMMADINQRYGTLILLISTGLLLVGIAIAIPQLF